MSICELDYDINELEKDLLKVFQNMENKDIINKEIVHLQEENDKLVNELKSLSKERDVLYNELTKELKLHDNLKKNHDILEKTILIKETACTTSQNSLEINDRDNLRLKKAKEQFQIGKDFTGIRWDYSAPPNLCKGYIVNKSKKTIDTFELDKDKYSEEKIQEFLWSLIEKHSDMDWNDLVASCNLEDIVENKENKKSNK